MQGVQGVNIIWVFDPTATKVLMCKRQKPPYLGLYNLVGGKIEPGEEGLTAAYRELAEETGITDISLTHIFDLTSHIPQNPFRLEVYIGRLGEDTPLSGDEKELVWFDVTENFFDLTRFASDGKIGYVFQEIKRYGLGGYQELETMENN